MTKDMRLATKAQADAVRTYLQTLGVTLSHVQALEVIARGQGMRSRHALAAQVEQAAARTPSQWVDANVSGNPALMQAMRNHAEGAATASQPSRTAPGPFYCTRVSYGYVDGSNCKRFSSMVFRGRLSREQLQFIASRLDEGLYFVPCQVGFESLHLAFTDDGGDDHYWHKMELGDEDSWTFDDEGYVLKAGDIEQVPEATAGEYATDADCGNLFWRFARVLRWDDELQREALTRHAYQRPEVSQEALSDDAVERLVAQWRGDSLLRNVPQPLLVELAGALLEDGFLPFPGIAREVRRPVGPNAYQFCILEDCDPQLGDLVVNFDVSTTNGTYLTETPVLALSKDKAFDGLSKLSGQLQDQLRAVRVMPEAYDAKFE